ncbi:MAG: 16S rRNA (guanine(966)-N(2))-methyltransferase RsmD [Actinomycetota bacterium]|nr:16S rRNA (guanine(966)-N(2))-methyltransferase RsmD [Actinomycetota bacterium]
MTRILAGQAGGRRIAVPPRGTRPTSERVREAVFSALEARMDLDGARVLDLYAGSGAMGLEALSRGAGHARFVESDRRAVEVLRRNVAELGLSGVEVTVGAVEAVLRTSSREPYDLVLADPPYALGGTELTGVLAALLAGGWLVPGALMVVERSAHSAGLRWPTGVVTISQRRYGDTRVYYGSAP